MTRTIGAYAERRLLEIRSTPSLIGGPKELMPVKKPAPPPLVGTKRGHVYFIADGDYETVKIGFTTNLSSRLRGLNTGNAKRLVYQESFATFKEAEKMVHKRFGEDRIRGEWFTLTCDIEELWDDITDYQRAMFEAGADVEAPDDVFFGLEAVETILATINEPWPKGFIK